jgi:glucose-6-phosphate 1-dehydrogenase
VNPDRLALQVDINGPGDPFCLEPVELDCRLAPQEPSAYARLLVDVFDGNPVLSIRADEAEECWRIVEPVLDVWRRECRRSGARSPAENTGPVLPGKGCSLPP